MGFIGLMVELLGGTICTKLTVSNIIHNIYSTTVLDSSTVLYMSIQKS